MPAPNRKTVSVDALRELLGERRADELLEKLNPPRPTVQVKVTQLSTAQKLYADPLTESKSWDQTIDVIRRYFLERAPARRAFLAWVDQASRSSAGPSPDGSSSTRRKITDPAVLEKRRAALAKARAARSQRARAARGES
jgi:hypothetical protein